MGQPFAHIRVKGDPSRPGGLNGGAGVTRAAFSSVGSSCFFGVACFADGRGLSLLSGRSGRGDGFSGGCGRVSGFFFGSSAVRSFNGWDSDRFRSPSLEPACFARRCGPPPSRQGARACRRPAEGPDRRSSSSPSPLQWSGLSWRSSAPRSATAPPGIRGGLAIGLRLLIVLAFRQRRRRTWPARPCRMRRSSWVSITSIVRSAPV